MRKGLWLLASLLAGLPALAQEPNPTLDKLSRWIEIPQHEKLFTSLQDPNFTLGPFVTDGCSGGMSAAWRPVATLIPGFAESYIEAPPWEACCVVHDQAYHTIGDAQNPSESFDARLVADSALKKCVLRDGVSRRVSLAREFSTEPEVVDQVYDLVAIGMYQAVRLGGGPCSGLSWRWGYGYPSCFWE